MHQPFAPTGSFSGMVMLRLMSGRKPAPEEEDGEAASAAALAVQNAALRAQLSQARLVLDSATDHAIITMDSAGRITSWNTGARRILGYAEAEVLGRSGEIVFTSEDLSLIHI